MLAIEKCKLTYTCKSQSVPKLCESIKFETRATNLGDLVAARRLSVKQILLYRKGEVLIGQAAAAVWLRSARDRLQNLEVLTSHNRVPSRRRHVAPSNGLLGKDQVRWTTAAAVVSCVVRAACLCGAPWS